VEFRRSILLFSSSFLFPFPTCVFLITTLPGFMGISYQSRCTLFISFNLRACFLDLLKGFRLAGFATINVSLKFINNTGSGGFAELELWNRADY
jgi:hypothetical protein